MNGVSMEFGNKGAFNEIMATAWLLKDGYYVFRNVSAHGPIDLIAMKQSEVHYIDVKSAVIYKDKLRTTRLTKTQIALGVKAVVVFKNGYCKWNETMHVSAELSEYICESCAQAFENKRPRKFCSTKCASTHHNALLRAKRATNGP